MSFYRLEPVPKEEVVIDNASKILSPAWLRWFGIAFNFWNSNAPSVGDDIGDADATLYPGKSAVTQILNTAITAPRTITLSTDKARNGTTFAVVRRAGASGVLGVSVGGLKTLAVSQWCEVQFNGTAYILTKFGSL